MTVTGPLAACESLTVKVSWLVPLSPSVIEASSIEMVGTMTGGGVGVSVAPFKREALAVVPPEPGLASKPKLAWPPAGTSAVQAALRIT